MSEASTARDGQAAAPRTTRRWSRGAALLLVLIGVMALVYPVIATQYNNAHQRELAAQYAREVEKADVKTLDTWFSRARRYNGTLDGVPILDPWLARVSSSTVSGPYRHYLYQLSSFDSMARLRVPEAGVDLPVRHGTDDEAITTGVGHLYGTSLPVGGEDSHSVLTSHTGLGNATLFDDLDELTKGDIMFIDVAGRTLAYEVDQVAVVLPNEIDDLKVVKGHDYLTLFTCTPYAVNSHRLLVRGERIPYTPERAGQLEATELDRFTMQPWMWWTLAGASTGLVVAGWILVADVRARAAVIRATEPDGRSPRRG